MSSCLIAGIGYSAPSRLSCIAAGGFPLSDETVAQLTDSETPIISPPPIVNQCSIQLAQEANVERSFLTEFDYQGETYFRSSPNSFARLAAARQTENLLFINEQFGYFSSADLLRRAATIYEESGVVFPTNNRLAAMQDIVTCTSSAISPNNLPRELSALLQATGYYNLVLNNLQEIFFTPRINDANIGEAEGNALPWLGLAEVTIFDLAGQPQPLWKIASILVHEAAHNSQQPLVPNELRRPLLGERHAMLVENAFLIAYLRRELQSQRLTISSSEALNIAHQIALNRLAIQRENLAAGYAPNNNDPYCLTLPINTCPPIPGSVALDDPSLGQRPEDLVNVNPMTAVSNCLSELSRETFCL